VNTIDPFQSLYHTDRRLFQDFIQKGIEDEPLQLKEPMTKTKSKRWEDQNYSKLLMLQVIWNSKDMQIMAWSTFQG